MPNNDPTKQGSDSNTVTTPPPVLEDIVLPPMTDNKPISEVKEKVTDTGSAAPSNDIVMQTQPISSNPRKKFAGGRVIATILGLFLLVGGLGAGVMLVGQNQNPNEQAAGDACTSNGNCAPGEICVGRLCKAAPSQCGNNRCDAGEWESCPDDCGSGPAPCDNGEVMSQVCSTTRQGQNCPGTQSRTCSNGKFGPWSSCQDNNDNCPIAGSCQLNAHCQTGQICQIASGQTYGTCVNTGSSCSGSLPPVTSGNTNSITVVVSQTMRNSCTAKCGDATLYASICTCSGINLTGGCNTNCQIKAVTGDSVSADNEPTCGTVQVDVGCKNTFNTYGSLAFSSKQASAACGGNPPTNPPSNPPVVTPSPTPITASCQNVKAYSTTWTELTSAQLSALKANAQVNFCVTGVATGGSFDKAKFTINNIAQAETSAKRPNSNDFCQLYTIPSGTTSFNITAQIHHVTLGWK